MRVFTGIAASPGIAVGRLKVVDRQSLSVSEYHISSESVAAEITRLKDAIAATHAGLESLKVDLEGTAGDAGDSGSAPGSTCPCRKLIRGGTIALFKVYASVVSMFDVLRSALGAVRSFCRTQRELALENLALRHHSTCSGARARRVSRRSESIACCGRGLRHTKLVAHSAVGTRRSGPLHTPLS